MSFARTNIRHSPDPRSKLSHSAPIHGKYDIWCVLLDDPNPDSCHSEFFFFFLSFFNLYHSDLKITGFIIFWFVKLMVLICCSNLNNLSCLNLICFILRTLQVQSLRGHILGLFVSCSWVSPCKKNEDYNVKIKKWPSNDHNLRDNWVNDRKSMNTYPIHIYTRFSFLGENRTPYSIPWKAKVCIHWGLIPFTPHFISFSPHLLNNLLVVQIWP